jgi:hypothetical protein
VVVGRRFLSLCQGGHAPGTLGFPLITAILSIPQLGTLTESFTLLAFSLVGHTEQERAKSIGSWKVPLPSTALRGLLLPPLQDLRLRRIRKFNLYVAVVRITRFQNAAVDCHSGSSLPCKVYRLSYMEDCQQARAVAVFTVPHEDSAASQSRG